MDVVKVLNDGVNLKQSKNIITFLTSRGWRTPKYIWVGISDGGIELYDMTKKGCISKIERDNRKFGKTMDDGCKYYICDMDGNTRGVVLEELKDELLYGISESGYTAVKYDEEFLDEKGNESQSFDEFCEEQLDMYVEEIRDGYCVEIYSQFYMEEGG